MKMDATGNTSATQEEFVISRIFNAPRKRVWSAWTEREQLMRWFGPQGCTLSHATLDLKVGGIFHYAIRMPDGQEMWGKWTFHEISSPNKLVLTNSFSDAHGGITRHPMSRSWPLEMLSSTTFEAEGNRTRLTLRWSPWNATELERKTFGEAILSMEQGWNGTFAQLDAYLERMPDRDGQSTRGNIMLIQPYLFFDGRCEEAIEFYRHALGAEVTMLMRYKDSPEPPQPGMIPPGSENKVMHASLKIGDATVMASDGNCLGKPVFQGVSLSLTVKNDEEAERSFAALCDGGQVQMPLTKTFFSSRFGMVEDRFGVSWMIIVAQ